MINSYITKYNCPKTMKILTAVGGLYLAKQMLSFLCWCSKNLLPLPNNLKKKYGDKLTEEKILEFVNEGVQAKKEKNTFYLYTESGDPNNAKGYKTKFCEASKVVLSGHFYKFNGSWSEHAKAGSFSIE